QIIPAVLEYQDTVCGVLAQKKAFDLSCGLETYLAEKIAKLSTCMINKLNALENALLEIKSEEDALILAQGYHDKVFTAMSELRMIVDQLETVVGKEYWPFPDYGDLLYSVL
ncbi:MAG: glutamine synthetase type III, partial [Eubacteriales bacterium]